MKWNRKPQQTIPTVPLSANSAGSAKSGLSLQGQGTRYLRTFSIIFAVLAAGIIAAGYFYYNNYENQFRRQVEAQLKSIADLKVGELVHWREERLGDGTVYSFNRSFHALAQRYFNNPTDSDVRGQLQGWMRELQLAEDYSAVFLFDASGSMRLSSQDDSDTSFEYHQEQILENVRSGKVTFLDLHHEPKDKLIHLSIIVPLIGAGIDKPPIGVLAMRMNPESYLYPLIERWPVPSKSAESLLIRRDGNDAIYLNTLKFHKDAALNVRIPLSKSDTPAVMAVLGTEGLVEGVDYRGVPVIAYLRAVPESPWFIVAKIDKSEVYAPLRERALILAAMIGILLLGAGTWVMLISHQQHTRAFSGLAQSTEALRASEKQLREAQTIGRLGSWEWDVASDTLKGSEEFYRLFDVKPEEIARFSLFISLLHPADRERVQQEFAESLSAKQDYSAEYRVRLKDGSWREISARGRVFAGEDGTPLRLAGTCIDITERKKAEQALTNEAIRRRILVSGSRDGIVVLDTDGKVVEANRKYAEMLGYTPEEVMQLSVWDWDTTYPHEAIQGMLDAVSETGDHFETRHTRKDGTQYDVEISSNAAVIDGRKLIFCVCRDITERKKAEAAMVASEVRYRRLFEAARDGILILNADTGKITDINPFLAGLLGAPREELLGQELWEIGSFRDIAASKSAFMELQDKGYVRYENLPLIAADGRRLEVEFISNVYEADGHKVIQCNIRDITERKQAEALLLKYRNHLEELVEERTQKMKETASLLGATLESTADGILAVDNEGRITAHNNNFLKLWNVPSELAKDGDDHRLLAFVSEQLADPEAFVVRVKALYSTPEVEDFDTIYLKDGRVFERLSMPQRMGNKLTGRVWSFRDITERKKAERELEESDERYRAFITNSTEGVWRMEAIPPVPLNLPEEEQIDLMISAGVLAECNDAMAQMNGLQKADDLVGATFQDLFSRVQDSGRDFLRAFIISGYKLTDAESAEFDVQGNLRYFLNTFTGIVEDGMLLRAWGNQREITERKKAEWELESSRQMMRTVLDAFPGIVFWKDLNLSFLGCNSKLAEMAGLASPADIVGRPDRDFPWSSQSAHYLIDDLQVLNSGEPKLGIIEKLPQLDGGIVWLNTSKVPLRNAQGDVIGLLGTSIDITELKRTEDALEIAKEAAENANHAKSTFLANMSHEIRTPMNAVLGYTQILQRDATLSPTQMKYVETIGRSGEFLLSLINDILEMSKIEAGKVELNPAPFDFCAMLRDIETMFSQRAEEKRLQLTMSCVGEHPQIIVADAMRVRQVITNMLGNAIKFTSAGGISVQVQSSGRDAQNGILVTVEVKDTGMGISSGELESVFGSFEQTQTGQMIGGTGLGMAISRQLARLMGGGLTVHSEVDKGSTFTFTFHAVTSPNEEVLGAAAPVIKKKILGLAHLPGPRILVVDDKETNRDVLKIMLGQIGFTVRDAADGEAAIALFNEWHPDAILMDNRMPVMDGLEATKRIKAAREGMSTSIIMVTASAMDNDKQDAIKDGVDGFVRKPYNEGELLAELGRLLKLEYIYDEPQANAPEPKVSEAIFAAETNELPSELNTSLKEAAEMGDRARLLSTIKEQVIPHWSALGEHLFSLAQHYNYEQILNVLGPAALVDGSAVVM